MIKEMPFETLNAKTERSSPSSLCIVVLKVSYG